MGALAEAQVADAMHALAEHDGALALRVIQRDDQLDRNEVEIDRLALAILADHRPRGPDLRFVTMSLKFVTDLERIGDLAAAVARRVVELARFPPLKLHADLPRLADNVRDNLHAVLDCFVRRDAERAQQVIAADVEIDRLNAGLFCELIAQVATDYASVTQVVPLTSVSRYLERIGDHVKNLAEEVVYMVRAVDLRHRALRP
jgi:phosphate transport system protein